MIGMYFTKGLKKDSLKSHYTPIKYKIIHIIMPKISLMRQIGLPPFYGTTSKIQFIV